MAVSAIVPAYNEEGWVGKTVEVLFELPEIWEVIVVDDGSQDKTFLEAWEAGAKVVRYPVNKGKSQALREGVRFAKGDILAFVDADLQDTALEMKKLIHPVLKDEADMAIGSFFASRRGGFGLTKRLASWSIRHFTGQKMFSPLSGQRVLKRCLWEVLDFWAEGFAAEIALTIESLNRNFKVIEIPVEMSHRYYGNNIQGFLHRGSQFYSLLKFLLQKKFYY